MKMVIKWPISLEEPHHSDPAYLKANIIIYKSLRNLICIIVAINAIYNNLSILIYNCAQFS